MTATAALCCLLLAAGCGANRSVSKPMSPASGRDVVLRRLSYHDGLLEGELANLSDKTARVVMVEVSFLDAKGRNVLTQEFKAVPGGDGRALLPRYAKHFNYKLRLDASSRELKVVGRIKSIQYG